MEKGVDFYYYKVDRTGKIVRFSVKGLKGMTPDEMVTTKNADIAKFATLFKKEMDAVFTLSLEEAQTCSRYVKNFI
jgi:hypothetical protein